MIETIGTTLTRLPVLPLRGLTVPVPLFQHDSFTGLL